MRYDVYKQKIQSALDERKPDAWITVNGTHIPIFQGQTRYEAVYNFLDKKGDVEGLTTPTTQEKTYVEVPFEKKDIIKDMGGKWDADKKKWYLPKGFSIGNTTGIYSDAETDLFNYIGEIVKIDGKEWSPNIKKVFTKKDLSDGFKIVAETKKAKQIEKDGIKFWIQNRMLRDDGTLTKAGIENFNNAKYNFEHKDEIANARKEEYQEKKKAREELEKQGLSFKKDWENDKAVGVDVNIDFYDIERDKTVRLFFPKKLIKENGNLPLWIVEQKMKELKETLEQDRSRTGGYSIYPGSFYFDDGDKEKNKTEDSAENDTVLVIHKGKLYEVHKKSIK